MAGLCCPCPFLTHRSPLPSRDWPTRQGTWVSLVGDRACALPVGRGRGWPQELPVPSSLSHQFVVCEPVEIAGSINERKTRGFVSFLTQKYWGTLGLKILRVLRGTKFAFPRLSDFTLLYPVGKLRQARCDPNTYSPPSLLWSLKVSVAHASVHRPEELR